MIARGLILLADDEHSFLRSTTELLRKDGYECDAAGDADQALIMLQQKRYDLLIADIKMPGNPNLRIVRGAQKYAPGMPIILVTGYPSMETAMNAVELPVLAYLVKPVDYDVLCEHIETALKSRQVYRTLIQIIEGLRICEQELETASAEMPRRAKIAPDVTLAISPLTVRRLASCLGELLKVLDQETPQGIAPHLCQAVDCPQWPAHQAVFFDVIEVMREVKNRFKSKELGELRERLERHLGISKN